GRRHHKGNTEACFGCRTWVGIARHSQRGAVCRYAHAADILAANVVSTLSLQYSVDRGKGMPAARTILERHLAGVMGVTVCQRDPPIRAVGHGFPHTELALEHVQ